MAKINRFEELIIWQKAQDLAVKIYTGYENCRDYGFRKQICNAAVSVSNNVSEGFDRGSKAQFAQFLDYAKGSCGEVKSMTYLAKRLNYIDETQSNEVLALCEELSRMIFTLTQSLRK